MKHHQKSLALALALAASLPAAPVLAQVLPASDFTKYPEAWEVSMSPSGKHVALAVPAADSLETTLEVTELATGKSQIMRFGRQQHVSDIIWTADDQLVGSSRVDLQACKLEYSIVSPK